MFVHFIKDGLKVSYISKRSDISANYNLLEDPKTKEYIAIELSNHHGIPVVFGFIKPIANFTEAFKCAEKIIRASHLCDLEVE